MIHASITSGPPGRSVASVTILLNSSMSTASPGHSLRCTGAPSWTTYPVPSSSADDPFYNADGLWKGERKNCPWNGRVWPMTNSHIAEVLAA